MICKPENTDDSKQTASNKVWNGQHNKIIQKQIIVQTGKDDDCL